MKLFESVFDQLFLVYQVINIQYLHIYDKQ